MVVALADLASRFPNVLEPWTGCIYATLEGATFFVCLFCQENSTVSTAVVACCGVKLVQCCTVRCLSVSLAVPSTNSTAVWCSAV
jgi:hypothetical protein